MSGTRPPRRGTKPGGGQDPADRPLPHPVPKAGQLAPDAPAAPARIQPRQLFRQAPAPRPGAAVVPAPLDRDWIVQVVATPAALEPFNQVAVEQVTGGPVRSQYSKPGSLRSRIPDAIIVAPATYNTINKWAQGTSDTYALGVLAEMTGMGTPIVVLPFVNSALAGRVAFRRSVQTLRSEGVHILLCPDGFEPHPSRTGGSRIETFPWHVALDEADRMVDALAG